MKYFTERELGVYNATLDIKQKMYDLVTNVLDPLREEIGAIRVTSGYRTPAHNKKVGGSPTSQHCKGEAVDIQPIKFDIDTAFALIIRQFKYDQVILERKGDTRWIHISYSKNNNRQKAMTAVVINGKATYKNI